MLCFDKILSEQQNTAVALGFFDGLHIGHRSVISSAAKERKNGLLPVCFTFAQSPKSVITDSQICSVMTYADKINTLSSLGIEHTYFADFRQVMNLSAKSFVEEILIKKLNAKKLFCGFNYRFGKNAEGNTEVLQNLCNEFGVKLTVLPPTSYDGQVVSSTLIKQLITEGNVKKANTLLCGQFGFCCEIKHGKQLGRELGIPTINQPAAENLILPKFGVYASVVTLQSGEQFCGVTNVGIKPTVGGTIPLWETWMPKYHGGEIYGQQADIRLIDFIRPEKKFDSLDDLKAEIIKNSKTALEIFKAEHIETRSNSNGKTTV